MKLHAQWQSQKWNRQEVQTDSALSHIDPDQYATLRVTFGKHINALVAKYITQSFVLMDRLKLSVESANFELIRRYANTLKGSSTSVAAMALAQLCSQLEQNAKSNIMEGASELAYKIHREYIKVVAELDQITNQTPPN